MYNSQFKGPTAFVSLCALVLGPVLLTFMTSPWIRYIGPTFCIAGCVLFGSFRYTFSSRISGIMKQALNGDLKDIGKTFGMTEAVNDKGEKTGEYVPSGKSGFWVAEAYEEGSEVGHFKAEIIGSVGLGMLNCRNRSVT